MTRAQLDTLATMDAELRVAAIGYECERLTAFRERRAVQSFVDWFAGRERARAIEASAILAADVLAGARAEGGRVRVRPIVPAQVPGSAIARDYARSMRRMQR